METPSPLRILVVDDDPFMLELMRDMLETAGRHAVSTATSARAALATLAQGQDLLVCDLSMPDMDGIEFLTAAAQARYTGSVLLLSGMDRGVLDAAEGLARALGLDVIGACAKPLSMGELRDILQAAGQPAARQAGGRG